jgi:hypothetical protein
MRNNKYTGTIQTLAILFLIVFGFLTQLKSANHILFSSNTYDSSVLSTKPREINSFSVGNINNVLSVDTLNLNFKFISKDPEFQYGNLFQTGDSSNAIRMEIQPPHNLFLFIGNEQSFLLENNLNTHKEYKVELNLKDNKDLKVKINNQIALNYPYLNLNKFDFKRILVGSGYAGQRGFIGEIKDFTFDISYAHLLWVALLAKVIFLTLISILFINLFIKYILGNSGLKPPHFSSSKEDSLTSLFLYSFFIFIIFLSLGVIQTFCMKYFGFAKWLPYLILPVIVLTPFIFGKKISNIIRLRKIMLASIAILCLFVFAFFVKEYKNVIENTNLNLIFLICTSVISTSLFFIPDSFRSNKISQIVQFKINDFISLSFLFFLVLFSWFFLFDLTNWESLILLFEREFLLSTFLSLTILFYLFYFIFDTPSLRIFKPLNFPYFNFLVFLVFIFFSFRHDSLFIPGSEYHWEYFHGVIQGIRNGGWLLWDTPSQYGFLNVLLASIIPVSSAWQALYIMQSFLLLIVSCVSYWLIVRNFKYDILKKMLIFFLVFFSLFYADPHYIGPYPFPSSSVFRFFCIYLMIFLVFIFPKFDKRQAFILSSAWVLSCLWSAESALYGTSILFFLVASIFFSNTSSRQSLRLARQYLMISLILFSSTLASITAYYFIKINVLPDFRSFFEHAIGYASGHGYVPFTLFGPSNLLLFIFLGLIIALYNQWRLKIQNLAPIASLAGALWAISSYYIGRPVPQNITAMLPIITIILLLCMTYIKSINLSSLIIRIISVPLFFLILSPIFTMTWYQSLTHLKFFSTEISEKLPEANSELVDMMDASGFDLNTFAIYYGDDAAPPIFKDKFSYLNGKNWLPVPLQLLEPPISEEKRDIYLARYICGHQNKGGFIIVNKNDLLLKRFDKFLVVLKKYYVTELANSSHKYDIYRFSNFNPKTCQVTSKNSL